MDANQTRLDAAHATHEILAGRSSKSFFRQCLPFLGPAFIASVAYMDPGNFATNIQAGAKYGYMLLWVIVASNLMAMLIQTLSAKLGIAAGLNLAELCREHFPAWASWVLWVLMEVVAMATDLAEFLGAALGFNLLLGVSLFWGGVMTAVATFFLLGLERRGMRRLEAGITALVAVVAGCYLIETIIEIAQHRLDWRAAIAGAFIPRFSDPARGIHGGADAVVLAAGILGATVMPHAIFLHSSLTQNRIATADAGQKRRLFQFELVDVIVAMGVAGLVNAAMLVMAATTFFQGNLRDVGTIEEAHRTLEPLLGWAAKMVFGLSLLAAGLSSTAVGTMAGQVMMQGFVHRHIPLWLRRGLTMAPSFVIILLKVEPTRALVISQVVLSFGLPFAIIPLVYFTRRRDIMGALVNRVATTIIASVIAALVVALNVYLLHQTIFGG